MPSEPGAPGPSVPVQVLGANGVPVPGDSFVAVKNEKEAREVTDRRQHSSRQKDLQPQKALTLEDLYAQIQQGEIKELNLVIKGDTNATHLSEKKVDKNKTTNTHAHTCTHWCLHGDSTNFVS